MQYTYCPISQELDNEVSTWKIINKIGWKNYFHTLFHGPLKHSRICHIWRPKLRGQFFKRTQQSKRTESCIMCYLDLCIQLFFFPKDNVKSLSGQNFKKVNIKNIKMKPPVAQFKKKSKKFCLFLKCQKSKSYIINTVVCCLHKEKDVKKTVWRKIGQSFLKIICFIS